MNKQKHLRNSCWERLFDSLSREGSEHSFLFSTPRSSLRSWSQQNLSPRFWLVIQLFSSEISCHHVGHLSKLYKTLFNHKDIYSFPFSYLWFHNYSCWFLFVSLFLLLFSVVLVITLQLIFLLANSLLFLSATYSTPYWSIRSRTLPPKNFLSHICWVANPVTWAWTSWHLVLQVHPCHSIDKTGSH